MNIGGLCPAKSTIHWRNNYYTYVAMAGDWDWLYADESVGGPSTPVNIYSTELECNHSRQMVPRRKDDNANQRPNIESLEVDKILRFVDCQN